MNESPAPPSPQVVGIAPWLPWPLSAWTWWTEPVRAERLALLRMGVALCLLVDIGVNYAPHTFTFFGMGNLGDPQLFDWRFKPERLTWSLLRGVGEGMMSFLSLALCVLTTCWILGTQVVRLLTRKQPTNDRTGIALVLWASAFFVYAAGVWSRPAANQDVDWLAWSLSLLGLALASLFLSFDLLARARDDKHRMPWLAHFIAFFLALTVLVVSIVMPSPEEVDKSAWWFRMLQSWQADDALLVSAMCLWIGSAWLLLLGCATRLAAILAFAVSLSFANANMYLDNAGDTVRSILLFYLMLCPCGAVWSVDALFKRPAGPVYVHPWPIRLIFVQMIFIYFMNGVYKVISPDWRAGVSLHYVLGDLSLTRFSPMALPLPIELTRILTWSVLAWEVSFPLLIWWKWPCRMALTFGVLFHLGIFATMELAGFVPYALCMYLPLVPWEDLARRRENSTG